MAQIIGNAFRVTGVVCESCFNTSWLQAVELTGTMSMVALCLADSPMTAASAQTNIFQWIFVESIVLFVSNFLTRSLSNPDGIYLFIFKSNWVLYGNSYIAGFLPAATCWHSSLLAHHCDSGESPTSKCPSLHCQWDHVTGQWDHVTGQRDHVTSLLVNKNDDAHFIDTSPCWKKKRKEREREREKFTLALHPPHTYTHTHVRQMPCHLVD